MHHAIKAILISINLLSLIAPVELSGQARHISVESELKRLYDIGNMPAYINGSEVHQISSFDRKGGNNDGFEGTYSYLRKNDDGSLVVFEAQGKGVLERIWTPTPTDDTLDFYFDGSQTPSYSIKYRDLFSGNLFPFLSPVAGHKVGGFYSYLPMPFEKGCKIVFRGKKILFHQFQYRKYSDRFTVQTFNPQLDTDSKQLLQEIVTLWKKESISVDDLYKQKTQAITSNGILTPGKSLVLADIKSGGRILGIELEGAKAFEGLDNLIDIKVTWEGEKSPAIYAPVADFFGFAFGSKSMKSLLVGVDDGNRAYCFIPMPFDRSAKVELFYRKASGSKPSIKVSAKVHYNSVKRDAANEGKFYARWKREAPALGEPYVFLQGSGRGHYVGTILQSQGRSFTEFTEFFEGDDSTVIDGINALHGTGSEDYFNGGWYAQAGGWVERLGTALHGCLDYSLPYSRTGGYRFYLTDKLPFNQYIHHSIEHGPEKNNRLVDYISVAMYYAEKQVEQTSTPTNSSSQVFIPDTLTFYTRLMDHITYEGAMALKGGNAVLNDHAEGVLKINVKELDKGNYKAYLMMESGKAPDMEVRLPAGNQPVVEWGKPGTGNTLLIGNITIQNPGEPVLILFKANSDKVMLNRVMLVKQ